MIYGLATKRFYGRAFGLGEKANAALPMLFGRIWFVAIGIGFLYIAIRGALPLLAQRVMAIATGIIVIVLFLAARFSPDKSGAQSVPQPSAPKGYRFVLAMVVGIFFIILGFLLR